MDTSTPGLRWLRIVAAVAGAKILILTVAFAMAFLTGSAGVTPLIVWINAAIVLTYGAVGGALVVGGHLDHRARELGGFLILVASAFVDGLGRRGHPLGGLSVVLVNLPVEAFVPATFWLFVRDFPTRAPLGWSFVLPAHAIRASLAVGAVLFAANVAADLGLGARLPHVDQWLAMVSHHGASSLFWPVLFICTLPGAPVLIARSGRVGPGDRRRVRLFVATVIAGLLPISIDVCLRATSATWNRWVEHALVNQMVMAIVLTAFLSVPFTTAYSVVVARVVDLRLVVRRALQYALARYSVFALVSLPFAGIAWVVYRNRALTIQELLLSWVAVILLAGLIIATAAMRLRRRTLGALDRRFFREQYDAREILMGLVGASGAADSTERLVDLLAREIDRALHLDRIAILVRSDDEARFVAHDGRTPPLAGGSVLTRLIAASPEPLDVEPDNPRSALRRLDPSEQTWLADGGFRLLVPLRGGDGSIVGIAALGEKRSELPYSADDRQLLAAVGASGGMYLESRRALRTPHARDVRTPHVAVDLAASGAAARECPVCGLVHDATALVCTCGGALSSAPLPKMVAGKFHVERRIGTGGMGVVYRATDLALGRAVAIKTLPGTDADHTWRLRREARAMALVSHDNLATIYGAESWNGVPLLVQEYLAGGTLADRLRGGPMTIDATLQMGVALSTALEVLHDAGLVHRDVKPSNIGFAASGTVKLLDFGLAQIFGSPQPDAGGGASGDSTTRPLAVLPSPTHHAIGTPAYMSPEALRNDDPNASFDLWSLAVVLIEAVTGANPFRGETLLETVTRLARPGASIDTSWAADRPEVGEFFLMALAPEVRRRPGSAGDFRRRLLTLLPPG